MATFTFSARNYVFSIAAIMLSIAGLVYAQNFMVPFCFSLLIAFILTPTVRWLENKNMHSALAISITFLGVVLAISGIVYLFGSQITKLVSDFQTVTEDFDKLLNQAIGIYNESSGRLPEIDGKWVEEKVISYAQESWDNILSVTFSQTSSFLASAFLVPVYVFLLLFYRKGIKKGIKFFFPKDKRDDVEDILYDVQGVGKNYITGLFIVMLILAVANSAMLMIIGVDYAIMFGCLAALLIIIPYIGTYLGAALPILYALVTMDAQSALLILIGFVIVQVVEGNFLTPKIVGSNTNVNALTAFIALITGGYIWGVAGMVLSIPFVAMLKKIFKHVAGLQPIALLMGEELYEDDIDVEDDEVATPEMMIDANVKNKKNFWQVIKKLWVIWFQRKPKPGDEIEITIESNTQNDSGNDKVD